MLANLVEYALDSIEQVKEIPVKKILTGEIDWPDMIPED